jgi:beta-galactosidase
MKRTLGVCYYPEHWPEAQWAEDAARMAALGLTWVRIGEFAWSRMEPEPGRLRLGLAGPRDRHAGQGGAEGRAGHPHGHPAALDAGPHPDMLAVDAEGRPRGFGSRRHY